MNLCITYASILHHFMQQPCTNLWKNYSMQESWCTTVLCKNIQESGQISCKNLALLYARILHCFMQDSCTVLCKILTLLMQESWSKNLAFFLQDSCKKRASHAWSFARNCIFLQQGNHHNLARSCKTGLVEALVEVHEQSILGLHISLYIKLATELGHAPVIYTKIHIDLP